MKKVFVISVILGVLLLLFLAVEGKRIYEFEVPPSVGIQMTDPRPLIIYANGENGTATTQVMANNYQNFNTVQSRGKIEFYQYVNHSGVELFSNGQYGNAMSEMVTEKYKHSYELHSQGVIDLNQIAGLSNVEIDLEGKDGSVVVKTLTEKYKSEGELNSKGKVLLNGNVNPGTCSFNIKGTNGSGRVLTTTEFLKNGGSVNSLGDLSVSTVLSNPTIQLEIDGKKGNAAAQAVSHMMYSKKLSVNSLGKISLSKLASRHKVSLHLDWSNGGVTNKTSTPNQQTSVELQGKGELHENLVVKEDGSSTTGGEQSGGVDGNNNPPSTSGGSSSGTSSSGSNGNNSSEPQGSSSGSSSGGNTSQVNQPTGSSSNNGNTNSGSGDSSTGSQGNDGNTNNPPSTRGSSGNGKSSDEGESDPKITAKVQLNAESDGKLTIIRMNPRGAEPVATDAELVSLRMGMSVNDAQNYIKNNGGMNSINYAWQKANSYNPRPPAPAVAGRAGGMNGVTSVNVNTLSRPDVYKLHLVGPKYKGFLRDSTLYMRLYYPANGQHRIRGMYTTITVAETEPSSDVLLVQEFPYSYTEDYYTYSFDKENWLVNFDTLEGPYILLIDAGQSLNVSLAITITEDGQIIPRNGG